VDPLSVASALFYLTEVEGVTWRSQDYTTRNIVRGLKNEPFKGYSDIKVGGVVRRYDSSNIKDFVPLLMRGMGKRLKEHINGPVSIVPIPNSDMVVGAQGPFRIVELANELARGYGNEAAVVPAIRWIKPRDKAHKSNEFRSPDLYQPNMRLVERPKNQVVLFDDVMTSGSQMVASARLLSEAGVEPAFGVVGARATKTQFDSMVGWKLEDVPIARVEIDWDDLKF
jgi:adenine/guanine phosphoribosyltransferase-like PRPP-binding protein